MKKVIGYLKSCFSLRSSIIGSLALITATLAIALMLNLTKYEITINDNGIVTQAFVYSKTVEDALKEAGIKVSEYDELSLDRKANLKTVKSIDIIRAKAVNLAVNGEAKTVYTTRSTVNEVLSDEGIELDDTNYLVVPGETLITEGLNIAIIPRNYEEVVEVAAIPFETVKKANYNMESGITRTSREGVDGEKSLTYRVLKHNGEIVSKELVGEEVTKEPVNKVIEYGTIAAVRTSRGGEVRSKRVIECKATAYCLKGRTATGRTTQRGVVAVDPSVIPLGSKLYIETSNGSYVYGYAVAADTGGSIKGNKVDLYMETRTECLNFGVRNVKVYILE